MKNNLCSVEQKYQNVCINIVSMDIYIYKHEYYIKQELGRGGIIIKAEMK